MLNQLVRRTLILRMYENNETGEVLFANEMNTPTWKKLEASGKWTYLRTLVTDVKEVKEK